MEEKEIITNERKCGDLQSADVVIGSFARKILGKKAFVEADIIRHWNDIVGEEWANLTKPIKVDFKKDERKNGVLLVEAASGAVALELDVKSKIILSKVNTYFGYEAVSRIKLVQNLQIAKNIIKDTDNSEKKLVTAKEENYIEQQTKGISSPDLRATLNGLGKAILVNNRK